MYTCICGKTFEKSCQLGGHHSSCKIFLSQTGRLEAVTEIRKATAIKNGKSQKERSKQKAQHDLAMWLNAKPTCERCGKVMTEKFGSGRYCSRACANTREHSEETKQKISRGVFSAGDANGAKQVSSRVQQLYTTNPNICCICGVPLKYQQRFNKTCSEECRHEAQRRAMQVRIFEAGGNLNPKPGHGKSGFYKGIHCDSTWELAFVVYHLDHQLPITRNTNAFIYTFNKKSHKYYPDFILDDGTYVEIKNYWTEQVQAKIDSIPADKKYKILYKQDIKPYIDYCIKMYGKDFAEKLYTSST